jgi:hypothetical protein
MKAMKEGKGRETKKRKRMGEEVTRGGRERGSRRNKREGRNNRKLGAGYLRVIRVIRYKWVIRLVRITRAYDY